MKLPDRYLILFACCVSFPCSAFAASEAPHLFRMSDLLTCIAVLFFVAICCLANILLLSLPGALWKNMPQRGQVVTLLLTCISCGLSFTAAAQETTEVLEEADNLLPAYSAEQFICYVWLIIILLELFIAYILSSYIHLFHRQLLARALLARD